MGCGASGPPEGPFFFSDSAATSLRWLTCITCRAPTQLSRWKIPRPFLELHRKCQEDEDFLEDFYGFLSYVLFCFWGMKSHIFLKSFGEVHPNSIKKRRPFESLSTRLTFQNRPFNQPWIYVRSLERNLPRKNEKTQALLPSKPWGFTAPKSSNP